MASETQRQANKINRAKSKTHPIWKPEEDAFLLSLYPIMKARDLGILIGRSESSIFARAHKIGATKQTWNKNLDPNAPPKVLQLYKEGHNLSNIETLQNLSYHQIRWILQQEGIEIDRRRTGKKRIRILTPEEQEQIRRLWGEGQSILYISKKIRCSRDVIRRFTVSLPKRDTRDLISRAQKRVFTQEEKSLIIKAFTTGMKTRDEIAKQIGCARQLVSRVLHEEDIDVQTWTSKKLSQIIRAQYKSGKRKVSPLVGTGKKTPYMTPFQGMVLMRSTTEARRASELDSIGITWFYEVRGYPLSNGRNYIPDFWTTQVPDSVARTFLTNLPSNKEIRQFITNTTYQVEDVKGWFYEKHPSHDKIVLFRKEYPHIDFHVLVEQKKGGWTWL